MCAVALKTISSKKNFLLLLGVSKVKPYTHTHTHTHTHIYIYILILPSWKKPMAFNWSMR